MLPNVSITCSKIADIGIAVFDELDTYPEIALYHRCFAVSVDTVVGRSRSAANKKQKQCGTQIFAKSNSLKKEYVMTSKEGG